MPWADPVTRCASFLQLFPAQREGPLRLEVSTVKNLGNAVCGAQRVGLSDFRCVWPRSHVVQGGKTGRYLSRLGLRLGSGRARRVAVLHG